MALSVLASPFLCKNFTRLLPQSRGGRFSKSVQYCMAINTSCVPQTLGRRSANYHPPIWDNNYVQSLTSNYLGEAYKRQTESLKEAVRKMMDKVEGPLEKLELVDTVQRLGLSYHFEIEIKRILESIHDDNCTDYHMWNKEDLYATALQFRILRQHGYYVSQEVFNNFKDKCGNFKNYLCEDTIGLLYLYEASYLSKEGESILDEARDFTAKYLKENLEKNIVQNELSILVSHALELPLHWRMLRLEARWFIDVYERRQNMSATLLELAKLDFNMVQAIHQEDLKHVSSWWKNIGWGDNLSFARDRLMENFFWTVGVIFEPQFQHCRRSLTKLNALITTIDDVYDVYGTLEELELFTSAVERWDINAVEQLPDYMKICFLGLYNSINEMAYDTLKEHGFYNIHYLKKAWADLCKTYLQEAKWYHDRYTPTLEEYLDNAWISISAPTVLVHGYFLSTNFMTKVALECLEKYTNVIRWSSMILRLSDDLGTSEDELKRGDNPKSIQCYMHETGASKEDAREHIKYLIRETWKKMNDDGVADSNFNKIFMGIAVNLARMSQCMYQHGDGHGIENNETKDRVMLLLIKPIPLI